MIFISHQGAKWPPETSGILQSSRQNARLANATVMNTMSVEALADQRGAYRAGPEPAAIGRY